MGISDMRLDTWTNGLGLVNVIKGVIKLVFFSSAAKSPKFSGFQSLMFNLLGNTEIYSGLFWNQNYFYNTTQILCAISTDGEKALAGETSGI